jgi:hydrogenase nickel incorporation protein HypA/HybF
LTENCAVHELALSESVVEMVRERLGEARILRVRLRVGCLMAVVPEALRFSFEVCSRRTPLEGAALEIEEEAARGVCRSCGASFVVASPLPLCSCGSADVELAGGDQLCIREVEVA